MPSSEHSNSYEHIAKGHTCYTQDLNTALLSFSCGCLCQELLRMRHPKSSKQVTIQEVGPVEKNIQELFSYANRSTLQVQTTKPLSVVFRESAKAAYFASKQAFCVKLSDGTVPQLGGDTLSGALVHVRCHHSPLCYVYGGGLPHKGGSASQ